MIYPAAAIKTEDKVMSTKFNPCTLGCTSLFPNTGFTTQYTKRNCVSAMKKRFGQRMSFINAVKSFNKKILCKEKRRFTNCNAIIEI